MPSVKSNGDVSVFKEGYADWWDARWENRLGGDGEQTYGTAKALYDDIVGAVIREMEIDSMVDLGCGACNQWKSNELPMPGKQFIGVDVSEKAIAHARWKNQEAAFIVGDVTDAKTWEEIPKVGLITSSEVLNHIEPEHYGPLVARIFRTAQEAVILRMWQREDLHGAGGYHWSNTVPDPEGWALTETFHSPNSTVGATIYVYRRTDS
ncbi:MAG TPA: class I SAM-dependent methyltransferase [Phycisphaerae bacterium]|nr:class I SAM-dependent methyltransferase [Phycisphaerae bacterium]